MSGQALDLKRSAQIVRRYRILVGSVAALGLLLGIGYAMVHPPMLTSNALVVLPVSGHEISTQAVIAASDPVLSRALPNAGPGMSLDTLRTRVQVKSLTGNVLSISAEGRTAAQAKATTNAVANSYISYVGSQVSAVGSVQARLVAPASDATGSSAPMHLVTFALIGALAGAVAGALIALARGRGDRRLWERDRIADTVGTPVVASVSAGRPSDPAGWTKLLGEYEPGVIHAWSLRRALNQLGLVDLDLNGPGGEGSSVAVVSLASDRKALAIGPQLAAFAASLGIHVTLAVGPQQDEHVTASLRAACATLSAQPPGRSGHLRVTAEDYPGLARQPGTLAIVVAVVDGQAPRLEGTMRTAVTVLAVSAGTATAEQLARVSVSAAADGRGIAGIIVADPDPADHTTGRLPQPARPGRRRLPARFTGTTTETRR
jgi:capsular polysaccharide biosynthesis protein